MGGFEPFRYRPHQTGTASPTMQQKHSRRAFFATRLKGESNAMRIHFNFECIRMLKIAVPLLQDEKPPILSDDSAEMLFLSATASIYWEANDARGCAHCLGTLFGRLSGLKIINASLFSLTCQTSVFDGYHEQSIFPKKRTLIFLKDPSVSNSMRPGAIGKNF